MSPISSRKMVPPLACSNLPSLRSTAPVKAPFSKPKSSLSRSSLGIAAQLRAMNGLPNRLELKWMARAMSSLPVPDSPWTRTVTSLGATLPMVL